METVFGSTRLILQKGDITKYRGDAIVNAANSRLAGGGGVDGAIHSAGGRAIAHECRRLIQSIGHLQPGKAVVTTGGNLSVRYVIHTVGPVWKRDSGKAPAILTSAYRQSLALADKMAVKTVAFPSVSTGAYGYPLQAASQVALAAIREYLLGETGIEQVDFFLYSDHDLAVYSQTLEAMG